MAQRNVIPFGPQHPVLPEPIHLELVVEDERVVEAIPSIGFIHRGLEKLAEIRDIQQMSLVAERICGICSCIHGQGYCEGIERLLGIEAPPRATYLRVIWAEMSRIHSHLLWAGLLADAFGYESLFMHGMRVREGILDIVEAGTGGRVIFGANKIGGTRRDLDAEGVRRFLKGLDKSQAEWEEIKKVFVTDATVEKRLRGIGVLTKEQAMVLGAVGPTLRASGVSSDLRMKGYAAYSELAWEPVVEKDGDAYARMLVRAREVDMSFSMIRQALAKLPEGPFFVKAVGQPKGEVYMRLEQPRGEVVYYLKGNGTKNLERFRVRTPTFANIPPLLAMLKDAQLADVPQIVLAIDPCISCTER
jgi:ech hydrogenase subunit E